MRFGSERPDTAASGLIIELRLGSDAYGELWTMLDKPGTYLIRIDPRRGGIAIKRNEGVWSPTLSCEARPARPPRQPTSYVETVTEDQAWRIREYDPEPRWEDAPADYEPCVCGFESRPHAHAEVTGELILYRPGTLPA